MKSKSKTAGGALFGGEGKYKILKELVKRPDELVTLIDLSRYSGISSPGVLEAMKTFCQYLPVLFETENPYPHVRVYRMRKNSKLYPIVSELVMALK